MVLCKSQFYWLCDTKGPQFNLVYKKCIEIHCDIITVKEGKKTLHGPWVISTAYRAKHVVNKVISTWYFFCYRATYLTFSETTAMSQPPDPASQGSCTLVQTLPV